MACNLCGGESGKYFLCFKCNKLKDEGKVLKCPDCSKWYYADKGCACKPSASQGEPKIVKTPPAVKSVGDGACIVCTERRPMVISAVIAIMKCAILRTALIKIPSLLI